MQVGPIRTPSKTMRCAHLHVSGDALQDWVSTRWVVLPLQPPHLRRRPSCVKYSALHLPLVATSRGMGCSASIICGNRRGRGRGGR